MHVKTCLWLEAQTHLICFGWVWARNANSSYIFDRGCVDYIKSFNSPMWHWVKGKCNIYKKPTYGLKLNGALSAMVPLHLSRKCYLHAWPWTGMASTTTSEKNKGTHYFPQSSNNSIPVNIPDYIAPSIRQDHTAELTSKSAPTMNSTIIAFCQELMPSCLTWGGWQNMEISMYKW